MEPNDLLTPEITFELISRGIEPESTQILRRAQLRGVLAKEREGIKFSEENKFTFDTEVQEIEITLDNLMTLVSREDYEFTDLEIRRVESRLFHVQRRCTFLKPTSESEKSKVKELDTTLLIISGFLIELKDNSLPSPLASSTMRAPNVSNSSTLPLLSKQASINKWGIKFSGHSSKESVMSFLEKVNELCEARQVSEQDLFTSAVDLFTDTALFWYRNIKKEVQTWSELVACLKRDFLPVDYEDDLLAEIRARTQGPSENVTFYIIAVEALFNRLTVPYTEQEIIKQIRRNLNPFFADKLVLTETTSLRDLKDKCRALQELKTRNERYHPPPSKKQGLLEPDLACLTLDDVPSESKRKINAVQITSIPKIICWNCRRSGHSHRDCTAVKTIFCYKCGTKGNYSSSCVNCSTKNEQVGIVPNLPVSKSHPAKSRQPGTIPFPPRVSQSRQVSRIPNSITNPNQLPPRALSPRAATFVPATVPTNPNDVPSTSGTKN